MSLENTKQIKKIPCLVPVLIDDYINNRNYIYSVLEKLPVSDLIFVGSFELEKRIKSDIEELGINGSVGFIEENSLLSYTKVKESYEKRFRELTGNELTGKLLSRAGWYYQQFLKLEFYKICTDEYYLVWDADTIPLRNIELFNEQGMPYLDVKTEYNPPYFDTIYNLLGIKKAIEPSFISEHMLFKKTYVEEMLTEINESSLNGTCYYDKIFSAIEYPSLSAFSEFETYGTWICARHSNSYRIRNWSSIRNTGYFTGKDNLTEDDLKWLATGFDAATFEKNHNTSEGLEQLFREPIYREKLPADIFYKEILQMGVFGDYRKGGIVDGINIYAV